MGKARSITGFGPTSLTLSGTSSENGPWIKFGPFSGKNLTGFASFTDAATSQAAVIEGTLTTASTAAFQDIINFGDLTTASGTVSDGPKNSTLAASTNMFGFVRITTTSLASTGTMAVTVTFAASAGGQ